MKRCRAMAFNSVFWPLGILAALLVAFGPLLEEVVARFTWTRIPCHLSASDHQRFEFQYKDGKTYVCLRQNMWPGHNVDAVATVVPEAITDKGEFCWVNGAAEPTAVKNLDAWRHLDQGTGRFVGGGLVLLATAFIGIRGSRRGKKRGGSGGTEGGKAGGGDSSESGASSAQPRA